MSRAHVLDRLGQKPSVHIANRGKPPGSQARVDARALIDRSRGVLDDDAEDGDEEMVDARMIIARSRDPEPDTLEVHDARQMLQAKQGVDARSILKRSRAEALQPGDERKLVIQATDEGGATKRRATVESGQAVRVSVNLNKVGAESRGHSGRTATHAGAMDEPTFVVRFDSMDGAAASNPTADDRAPVSPRERDRELGSRGRDKQPDRPRDALLRPPRAVAPSLFGVCLEQLDAMRDAPSHYDALDLFREIGTQHCGLIASVS